MNLVDISHRAILLGEIADAAYRREIAIHRIEALEHDELRPRRIGGGEQLLEMRHVVVAEDLFFGVRLTDTLDHRIVVPGVRQDQAIRHQLRERRNASLVGDIAGGKDQRRFFAVQVGKLPLKLHHRMIIAGDVTGAAGAGAHSRCGFDHGANHLGVLAHAEVVVGAPDHDVLRPLRRMPDGVREPARDPLQIGKNAIAALRMQPAQRIIEVGGIVDR